MSYFSFVTFLVYALMNKSDKIYLDLLSFQDLQILKAKKSGNTSQKLAPSANPQLVKKRYAILTIMVGGKNVHYPIQLVYMEQPDPESLKRAFKRVSEEYNKIKNFDSEARSSSMSSTCNEFWKAGIANYNPTLEENKLLKGQLSKLKQIQTTLKTVKKDKRLMKDDFEIYKKKS